MKHTLKIESLSKILNERVILSNIYVGLATGDIVGLFGRNGSGKTTLFKILFGIQTANQLFFRYNDKAILNRLKFKKIFSLLTQDRFLPNTISVSQVINIMINERDRILFYEDEVLNKHLKAKVSDLSFGTIKYLEVKCILFNASPFCLLDELFNGLSPIICERIKKDILSQSKSKGIIITDHNYENVLDVSNKNWLLKSGSLKVIKNMSELKYFGYL